MIERGDSLVCADEGKLNAMLRELAGKGFSAEDAPQKPAETLEDNSSEYIHQGHFTFISILI